MYGMVGDTGRLPVVQPAHTRAAVAGIASRHGLTAWLDGMG